MATPWMDDDLADDEAVVQVDWAEVDQRRFDRVPRVQTSRRIDGIMYELCARAGLHWVRRSVRDGADGVTIFDGPMGSDREAEELWGKIIARRVV